MDKGGNGVEIVQELSVCPACAEKHAASEPTMVGGQLEEQVTSEEETTAAAEGEE